MVNESRLLIDIESFVLSVVSRRTKSKSIYNLMCNLLMDFKEVYNSDFYYSPLVSPFVDLIYEMDEFFDDKDVLLSRLLIMSFVDLKAKFRRAHRRHKLQLRSHRFLESENTRSLVNRMQEVSKLYSRILVVRVDLAYILKHQSDIGIQEFNHDMQVVRNRIRDRDGIFKGLIEYAWALEQGENKGYHCHLLLVYKGSKRRNGYYVAKRVGKLWADITSDQGCHFNCHATGYLKQYQDLNRVGIGMIHRSNQDEVNNMLDTVKYLVRPEKDNQYLRVKCKKRMRTFG